jgi:hypothetical protein
MALGDCGQSPNSGFVSFTRQFKTCLEVCGVPYQHLAVPGLDPDDMELTSRPAGIHQFDDIPRAATFDPRRVHRDHVRLAVRSSRGESRCRRDDGNAA